MINWKAFNIEVIFAFDRPSKLIAGCISINHRSAHHQHHLFRPTHIHGALLSFPIDHELLRRKLQIVRCRTNSVERCKRVIFPTEIIQRSRAISPSLSFTAHLKIAHSFSWAEEDDTSTFR